MADYAIVIGNKSYSSWSLRAWLPLRQTGADFEEVVIPLDRPESRAALLRHSPAGRVPVLRAGDLTVWDSLAIVEFLNERFPDAGLWPAAPEARALARSVAAEMHSGFSNLREEMPMDLRRVPVARRKSAPGGQLGNDIGRIQEIWRDCRSRFGQAGDFLFGGFGAADAFFAPVVTRFVTYGVPLDPPAPAYCDAVMSWPAMRDWIAAAKAEPWVIDVLQP